VKLYYFYVAPNPTKVRLYLAEKNAGGAEIPVTPVFVDLSKGEQLGPEHTARNPFQTLPVLELDDGTYVTESLAAMEYLEEVYPAPSLLGTSAIERARVRQLERIAESKVLVPIARFVHATKSPLGAPPSPEIAASARLLLDKGLAFFDALASDDRAFVAGAAPTIADCTLAAALNFGRFGGVEIDGALAHLARWEAGYRQRLAVQPVFGIG